MANFTLPLGSTVSVNDIVTVSTGAKIKILAIVGDAILWAYETVPTLEITEEELDARTLKEFDVARDDYTEDARVLEDGAIYKGLTDPIDQGTLPSLNPTQWELVSQGAGERVFIDEAVLVPATAGDPTDLEIVTHIATEGITSSVVYYNGGSDDTVNETHSWDVDSAGNVTTMLLPAAAINVLYVAWAATTAYKANDIVETPSGAYVKRVADGTSTAQFDATEAADWVYVGNNGRKADWAVDTFYFAGQEVKNASRDVFYMANIDHQSHATTFDSTAEAEQWDYVSQSSYSTHSSGTAYVKGEEISIANNVYKKFATRYDSGDFHDSIGWTGVFRYHVNELDRLFPEAQGGTFSGEGYYLHGSDSFVNPMPPVVLYDDGALDSARFLPYIISVGFEAGDKYKVRFTTTTRDDNRIANQVIKLVFTDFPETNFYEAYIDVGSASPGIVAGGNSGGVISGTTTYNTIETGNIIETVIDLDITITGALAYGSLYLSVHPAWNEDGSNVQDIAAEHSLWVTGIDHGIPSKFTVEADGWIFSTDGINASANDKIIVQSGHTVNLPANPTGPDEVQFVPANGDWTTLGATFATTDGFTIGAGQADIVVGADTVRMIAIVGDTNWLTASGGDQGVPIDESYNTQADLPSASTVPVGRRAIVTNDLGNEGVYVATGNVGDASASAWVKS